MFYHQLCAELMSLLQTFFCGTVSRNNLITNFFQEIGIFLPHNYEITAAQNHIPPKLGKV